MPAIDDRASAGRVRGTPPAWLSRNAWSVATPAPVGGVRRHAPSRAQTAHALPHVERLLPRIAPQPRVASPCCDTHADWDLPTSPRPCVRARAQTGREDHGGHARLIHRAGRAPIWRSVADSLLARSAKRCIASVERRRCAKRCCAWALPERGFTGRAARRTVHHCEATARHPDPQRCVGVSGAINTDILRARLVADSIERLASRGPPPP